MKPCSSSVVSLQLGAASSYLAAELWLLRSEALAEDSSLLPKYFHSYQGDDERMDSTPKPKTVFIDDSGEFCPVEHDEIDTDDVLWAGNTKLVQRPSRSSESEELMQTINMKRFHRKSFISCPRTRSSMQMPWFYARNDDDSTAMNSTIDDALDSLRFFAEASDRLEAIDLTVDVNSDLGIMAGKLIREIRDDFGNSVALPVWLLSNEVDISTPQNNLLAPEKRAHLLQSNLPLLYQDLFDCANLIMTLSTRPSFGERSPGEARKTTAKVLDTTLSFRGTSCFRGMDSDATILHSTHEFVDNVCSNRKLPLAVVEAWGSEVSGFNLNEVEILKSLQPLKTVTESATEDSYVLNPFLKLMSPLQLPTAVNYAKPFSNFLSVTGCSISDVPRKLFMECFDSKYRISGCATYSSSEIERYEALPEWWTAVGTSPVMEYHLKEVAASWTTLTHSLKDQFAKVGMAVDDSKQIGELLLSASEQYQK